MKILEAKDCEASNTECRKYIPRLFIKSTPAFKLLMKRDFKNCQYFSFTLYSTNQTCEKYKVTRITPLEENNEFHIDRCYEKDFSFQKVKRPLAFDK